MRRTLLTIALSLAAVLVVSIPARAQVVGSLPSGGSSATVGRSEAAAPAPAGPRVLSPAIRGKSARSLNAMLARAVLVRRGFIL